MVRVRTKDHGVCFVFDLVFCTAYFVLTFSHPDCTGFMEIKMMMKMMMMMIMIRALREGI
jgi:hypothetical protein